ncbi:B-cell receptor CD22-like [Alosa sapidissima]|uniref:B-cell receptor CD22-like n=1 Tax=Alosa sapidissima TaxID=34773 RepID=UPI001C09E74D|nr:B-cell receptor CD22-like [Alosa sapidissima]
MPSFLSPMWSLCCMALLISQQGSLTLGQTWGVLYGQQSVCVFHGASVVLPCEFSHPKGLQVKQAFWINDAASRSDISKEERYRNRVQYLGDKVRNCTLELSALSAADDGVYWFRMTTNANVTSENWTGEPGVQVSVTGLRVSGPKTALVGERAMLECTTTCQPQAKMPYTWMKNNKPMLNTTTSTDTEKLILGQIAISHEGEYACAHGNKVISSPAMKLSVEYPPKKTSISVTPPGEIVEGVPVTLTCSSDGRPSVKTYTWYKKTGPNVSQIGQGQNYTFKNISTNDSGQYFCMSANKHGGQNSTFGFFDILYPPQHTSIFVHPAAEDLEVGFVSMQCSSDGNPKVENYTWFKENVMPPVGAGQNYSTGESGWFYCEAWNKVGTQKSVSLHIAGRRKFSFLFMLILSIAGIFTVCIAVTVALVCSFKRRSTTSQKNQQAHADQRDLNTDTYVALQMKSISSDYETLTRGKDNECTNDVCGPTYENLREDTDAWSDSMEVQVTQAVKVTVEKAWDSPEAVYENLPEERGGQTRN